MRQPSRKLETMLLSNHVLRSPDTSLPLVLKTDASDRGVGAVLTQVGSSYSEKRDVQQLRSASQSVWKLKHSAVPSRWVIHHKD